MTAILSILERLANWRGLGILVVLYAVVFGSILATLARLTELTGGIGILDFDRGYTKDRVREVFESYGEEGFALFARIQLLDVINPVLYALIFACLTHLLWRHRNATWVVLLPLLAGALDYAENLTLFLLSRSFPDLSDGLVGLSSTLSLVKNVALFAAIAALLIGLGLWMRDRYAGPKT